MNFKTNSFWLLLFLQCLSIPALAQWAGGSGNGRSPSAEVKASSINAGGVSAEVNLFTGTLNTSHTLGTVTTPSGLSFTASLSHNSTFSAGDNLPHSTGIPYGEGWNLGLPMISINTEDFAKYSIAEKNAIRSINGLSTPNGPLHTEIYVERSIEMGNEVFDCTPAEEEGRLYYYSPELSIPGYTSGRLIFKEKDGADYVFVLNNFEQYVEARLRNGNWFVTMDDGTVFEMSERILAHRNPSNQRVQTVCADNANDPAISKAVSENLHLPKTEYLTWYCKEIKHPLKKGAIKFDYSTYGCFNFFKVYDFYKDEIAEFFLNNANGGQDLAMACKDVFINKIHSETSELIFNYDYAQTYPNAVDIPLPNDVTFDELYSETIVKEYNGSNFEQNDWHRYHHLKSKELDFLCDHEFNLTEPLNPYIGEKGLIPGKRLARQDVENDINGVPFHHGYLESERIENGIVAGDIYEVRTEIVNRNSNQCLFDINLATGDARFPIESVSVGNGNPNELLLARCYQIRNGESVYSTFNRAFKWPSLNGNSVTTSTSDLFVMPNHPDQFKGFHIQIGPANSDNNFSKNPDQMASGNTNVPDPCRSYFNINPGYLSDPTQEAPGLLLHSGDPVPHNFGIGVPWFAMRDFYISALNMNVCLDQTSIPDPDVFWWNHTVDVYNQCSSPFVDACPGAADHQWKNFPTCAKYCPAPGLDQGTFLKKVELIRYAKRPYMLTTVEYREKNSLGNFELKEKLSFKYEHHLVSRFAPVVLKEAPFTIHTLAKNRSRNIFVLASITQEPVHNSNPGIVKPTTSFEYIVNDTVAMANCIVDQFVHNSNQILLGKIVDPLGKETRFEYHDFASIMGDLPQIINITNSYSLASFSYVYRPGELDLIAPINEVRCTTGSLLCGNNFPIHSGRPYAYQTYAVVSHKRVRDHNNTEKLWTYDFEDLKVRSDQIDFKSNFQYDKRYHRSAGYLKATVRGPMLLEGDAAPEMKVVHTQEYNIWGKVKKVVNRDKDGNRTSSTLSTYDEIKVFDGVANLNNITEHPDLVPETGMYDVARFYETRDWPDDSFSEHYLNSYFIKKTQDIETVFDNGGQMATTTDYEYFDADHLGNTTSPGFTIMGISSPLTFQPSYKLFRQETSYSALADAFAKEEYFYLYDLINHPDHHTGNQPTGTILSQLYNNWKVRGMPFEVRTTSKSTADDTISHALYTIYGTNWGGSLNGKLYPKKIYQKVVPAHGNILRFSTGTLDPLFPYETLKLSKIFDRNENAQVLLESNIKGLKTETIYNSVGLPETTILGLGLNGEQRTTIVYNPDNTIQSLTDPNGTTLSYTYDSFLRLQETRRNGALIQDMTYSYWNGNPNLSPSFEERTDFNFVETNNYLSDTKSWYERAYVDPLGRPAAMIKEGVILENNIYDLWNRPVLQMKPQFGTAPVYGIPTGDATHLNQDFDVAPRSRPLASAKYGESLSGGHTVNSDYSIISHTDLIADLTTAGQTVLPEGYSFFKVKTTDEDGKEAITYTNQLGQTAATVTNNGTTATVFRYDSHGNVMEVINPLNQINNYHYNFLGQLYNSTTVDDGTTLFGYNSSGELVAQEFANGQKRLYQYDSFNRPVHQVSTQSTGILLDNEGMAWVTNSDFETTLNNLINSPTAKFEKKYYYNDYFSGGNYPANALPYLQNSMSNTLGRVAQTSSYDLDGILVENCFYSYDEEGFLKWEMKQFKEPNSTDKGRLVRIDYRDYNRQGSFEKQQVDLNCDGSLDVQYAFKYDNWNRLKKAFINYDDPDNTNGYKVVSYDYDDVIGAVKKKVYFDSTEDPGGGNNTGQCDNVIVDEINYTYDQRFRLTDITSHLFDWKLYYDGNMDAQHTTNFTANYNGNINSSRAVYKQENTNNILLDLMTGPTIYNYQYDNLNRLINADARVIQTGDTPNTTPCGDASYVYDKIGNLTQLTRCNDPFNINYPNFIYNYDYAPGTNRLKTVTDEQGNIFSYRQDGSGNLNLDSKRGIQSVAYGRAHLPWEIQRQVGGNTQHTDYLYDTNDQRIFKSLTESGNSLNKEYYIRTSGGQELGVFDINNNALTWYFYGNERVAKIPHQVTLSFTPGDAEGSPYTCTSSAPICNEESSGAQNLSLTVLRNNWITDPNALSLPENLYRIRICSGQELHILDSELGYLSGPYLTLQTIPINSLGDIFTYTTGNGVPETTTNLSGILLQRTIDEDVWINGYAACDPFNDDLVEIINPPIPDLTYYLYDHLGNTRVVYFTDLDCNGAITYFSKNMIDYFPYGKVFREKSSEQEKYLTTQHERDVETGLDYRGARFYDADIARFLSLDPLAAEFAAWSPYNYVLGNPVMLIDPDGKAPQDPPFTLGDLTAEAYKFKVIQDLHVQLNPAATGWGLQVHAGTSVTRGYKDPSKSGGIIFINNNQSIEEGVLDLAWELTNANNHDTREALDQKAIKGEISKTDFVMGIHNMEGEAMFNKITLATTEMGKTVDELKGIGKTSKAYYKSFLKGEISKEALIQIYAIEMAARGKVDAGDGKGTRPAFEVYGDQYDALRKEGEKNQE